MPVRIICSISLIYMTRMLGLFMVLPVIMLLGQDYAGATAASLGMALGIYGLTQAGLQIPLGMLSDMVGRRPVLVAGLILFALGSVVAALAESVNGLIIGRALQGAGAISSTLLALLADLTPPRHRTTALAIVGVSIGLSFSLAMVLGPMVAAWGGLAGIFVLTTGLALIALVLVMTLPRPTRQVSDGYQRWRPELLPIVLRTRGLWPLHLGIFCLHAVLAALFLVAPERLAALGYSLTQQGLIYLAMAAVALLALGPMMRVSERHHRPKSMILLAQLLVLAAIVLLPAGSGERVPTFVALALFFVGFNFLEASLPSWLSRLAPSAHRGTAMGVFSSFQFLGAAAGGILGGLGLDAGGGLFVLGCAAGFLLVWGLFTLHAEPPPLSRQITLEARELADLEPNRTEGWGLHLWAEQLAALDGVLDVHILDDESALMVRVSGQELDRTALLAAHDKSTTD
ncbi:MAG: MFS transporter [Natronospirillum sp.]|uniref:MFS transporter n=1 Tax=Natronospirillum sp. TaxID=2812955 RepID=UPI0025DC6179|nr:MFS transporter [Natronospirillum sp.]MCH8553049.1 MFS transporter [Natronospirillum sp.]